MEQLSVLFTNLLVMSYVLVFLLVLSVCFSYLLLLLLACVLIDSAVLYISGGMFQMVFHDIELLPIIIHVNMFNMSNMQFCCIL